MEQKQLTLDELMKLVTTGKATATQKLQFAEMLSQSAKQEAEKEKASKVELIDAFIVEQGLTYEEYVNLKKPAPSTEVIWEWTADDGTVHTKIKGTKGKWASKDYVKKSMTIDKALSFAKNEEGKAFIRKQFAS